MDNTVKLWDTLKAFDDVELDDFTAATGHIHLPENSQELLLGTYMTKSTPVIHLHFTRRNLLLAAGAYNPWVHSENPLLKTKTRVVWDEICIQPQWIKSKCPTSWIG